MGSKYNEYSFINYKGYMLIKILENIPYQILNLTFLYHRHDKSDIFHREDKYY